MARMYPDRILDHNVPRSERKVFDALKKLDDEWMVFHSVAWQGIRNRRESDGEADFVVAHPKKGALVVEVKGGGIQMVDGRWTTTNRHGDTNFINPFAQVRDSKHFLGGFLADRIPRVGHKVHMGHAVVFPDVEIDGALSPEAQRELIVDLYDLAEIERSMARVATHWGDSTTYDQEQFAALRKAIAPSRSIKRLLRHQVEERIDDLIELTDQQLLVSSLLRHQRRALIVGGAGTGKTVLAADRATQLAASGARVLLLCFNAPLGASLAAGFEADSSVTVGTFHKIARGIVADADMLPTEWGDDFWSDQLPALLPEAAQKLGVSFDAIVVDEGQDFQANWWTALELMLEDPDDAFYYVFADAAQDVYSAGWEPPFEGEPFELTINCRNTLPIAERVNAVFERDEPSHGAVGPKPAFLEFEDVEEVGPKIESMVEKLMTSGDLKPEQIAILSTEKSVIESLRGTELAGQRLTAVDGKGITVDTVRRFKGLEADAVILVVPEVVDDADLALAYVGMSRARVLLFVLGSAEAKVALNWA